jgi:protein-S-isoprenylcysteine O-methyltransferase Ste14
MTDSRAWAVAKVAVLAALFIAFFFLYLPTWLGLFHFTLDFHGWRALRLLGLAPLLVGAIIGLRCVFDFAWTGRGTPAPIDPPRQLVVSGFYRYVRNPMYVGFGLALISAWIVVGELRWLALICAVVLAAGIHLFVMFYEEPTLRRKFGADYDDFCRNVPRWIPRLHPWECAKSARAD